MSNDELATDLHEDDLNDDDDVMDDRDTARIEEMELEDESDRQQEERYKDDIRVTLNNEDDFDGPEVRHPCPALVPAPGMARGEILRPVSSATA